KIISSPFSFTFRSVAISFKNHNLKRHLPGGHSLSGAYDWLVISTPDLPWLLPSGLSTDCRSNLIE
ncbi:MAG: hypothetical protein KAI29_19640, partial [Cyclobacteriaceae bacterium]|nr:hypothetical protein [Cyclobacteriaceae bacterium]